MVFKNDFHVKITKRTLLKHDNNEMVTNWFHLINGRIYNKDETRYRKFRFVTWIDGQDLWFYDGDGKTDNDDDWTFIPMEEYLNMYVIPSYTDLILGYDDCADFYEACNYTIERWNERK